MYIRSVAIPIYVYKEKITYKMPMFEEREGGGQVSYKMESAAPLKSLSHFCATVKFVMTNRTTFSYVWVVA